MDDDGKAVQRLVRKKLFPIANKLCVVSQFCFSLFLFFGGVGLNDGETAIAHLYLRMFVDFINNTNNSGAIFFMMCAVPLPPF